MTFPIHDASPVRFPGPLPAAADVVIIGGGVVGVMTAWFLAERGLSVTLCEKGRIAGEQSSRNWGWVRQQGRDPGELPIMVESLRLWKSLAQELGQGLGFRQTGVLYLADTAEEMAGYEGWLTHARAHDVDSRILSREEVAAMIPQAAAGWKGGLWTASDARAEPWAAVPLLAEGAVRRGVTIVENCAVRALDIAAGRVAGVVTERGRIRAGRVLVAAGAWSRLFLGAHGVKIPQLAVLASVAATAPLPMVFDGAACDSRFAFRRRADGGYSIAPSDHHDFFPGRDAFASLRSFLPVLRQDFRTTRFRPFAPKGYPDAWGTPRRWSPDEVSPFERMRILNPAPNAAVVERLRDDFARTFPALGRPDLTAAWAGMIDTMPDVVPVVDHIAAIPGLTVATGMSGHGFGIGPGMGRVVASLVAGDAPGHDLSRFRFSRFSDGTKLAPGPSL
ncbi:NAD(P)/FAD-dependent oxidoreductase [Pseudogemmobacter blasticus]|uniref:FAD-dependent oxidoreductase n=1 Tax=Fuscovulum blasticum DSM 2131 TaxID=1188250 RepID=A0A2T4J5Q6_FUSBL|nr:FAD-binding oxidoreductase [Fuscovulum blasticum]PTE13234.1 FAD-dependent oxidoreductase [Fuscovulum blasticum DSM 2131]